MSPAVTVVLLRAWRFIATQRRCRNFLAHVRRGMYNVLQWARSNGRGQGLLRLSSKTNSWL